MKKYFNQKVEGCEYLVNLNTKKVNKTHIVAAANKVKLPVETMERAWIKFQETGGKRVDGTTKNSNVILPKMTPTVTEQYYKERPLVATDAAKLILEYMTNSSIKAREICNKNKIPLKQFYGYIHELNVKGTICGKTILNHKKYAKVNVLDAIWMYKKPRTTRKSICDLSATEKLAYKRVGDVLIHYLSAV